MNPSTIIEHVVLFKTKPDADSSAVKAMITNLNGLNALDPVLHLTAGPLVRCRSSLNFTLMLLARFDSKPDLQSYMDHQDHLSVIDNYVTPVTDDKMCVSWVYDFTGSINFQAGCAIRVILLKLKEGFGEAEKNRILGVLGGIRNEFPSIEQLSVGENFITEMNKGFSIGCLAVFKGIGELEAAANWESELVKVTEFISEELVLDYVVPSA